MACTAIATSPWPVISTTGSWRSTCSRRSISVRPSMPGSRISLMTMPGTMPASIFCSACSALAQPTTGISSSNKACWQPSSTCGSSSTNNTVKSSCMVIVLPLIQGQGQGEFGTTAGRSAGTQRPVGGGGQAGRQRQAQAQAALGGLGGEKRFEQVFHHVRRQAAAVVADGDGVMLAVLPAAEHDLRLGTALQRVHGVGQQVHQ